MDLATCNQDVKLVCLELHHISTYALAIEADLIAPIFLNLTELPFDLTTCHLLDTSIVRRQSN